MESLELEKDMEAYGDIIYRTAYMYVKNVHAAEDILQDVFIKLYTYAKVFENDEHKKAWLIRITINHAINYIKSPWNRKKVDAEGKMILAEDSTNIEGDAVKKETQQEVLKELLKLKKEFREVIYFYYYHQFSIKEISKLLGIPENTVKTRLRRGKIKLKNQLKGGYFSDEEEYR